MLAPGTRLGRYEIQRRLGRGGMGTVYVAHDPVLGRMVAIKVFENEFQFPDALERLSRESRFAAALSHPNIVTMYDFGDFDSQPYIVMEYVRGETLSAIIRRRAPVATAEKLRWIEELCAGAGYAHKQSVIHRDIKPANLMIDRAGRLKILDFGIAGVMGPASNTMAMIGTPGYMAPEQIQGKPVDHRADLFSIGVVFYELLAYTDAFPGETITAVILRILTEDPAPLSHLVPDVDPGVVSLIERALKKDVADRFEDAESMRVAIARIRRQFEADVTVDMPSADTPRRDVPPRPERISTDREAVARLRVAYMETALESARTLLEQNELTAALEACQQALAYDETNVRALDLAQRIENAMMEGAEAERETSSAPFEALPPAAPDPGAADRTVLKPVASTPPPSEATVLRPSPTARMKPPRGPKPSKGDVPDVRESQERANGRFRLWFGTNRKPVIQGKKILGFTGERDSCIHYGWCRVFIPESHKIGSIGSPWWKRLLTRKDDRLKLIELSSLAASHYWSALSDALKKAPLGERDAVVFIHGYNVSFEQAAIRSAQLGFDLDVPGVMAFYSWPSQGTLNGYIADEATIEASEGFIADYLTTMAMQSGAENVHVIAHSMGNRGLVRAIDRIATTVAERARVPFNQIILAAADIDQDTFRRLGVAYQKVAARTTMYVCSRDRAVEASHWLHDFPRAGFAPPVLVLPGIDTINVSNLDLTLLGHGYVAEARDLLQDIHRLIREGSPPEKRFGLRKASTAKGDTYWIVGA